MTAGTSRKRKVADEHISFQDEWTNFYLFVSVKEKSICLICNESVPVLKEYKQESNDIMIPNHSSKFSYLQGQLRTDKVEAPKKEFQRFSRLFSQSK